MGGFEGGIVGFFKFMFGGGVSGVCDVFVEDIDFFVVCG